MIAKKTRISWTQRLLHPAAIMRTAVLVGVLSIAGVGFMQSSDASAVQTSNDYCSQYSVNSQRNACKDGIKGTECNDYAITFDQETADICRKAAKAKADGLISDTPSFSPSPSTSTPHPPTGQDVANEATAYKNAILAACAPYQHDTAAALWCLYGGLGQNGTEGKPKTIADCLSKPELQGSDLNQGACITGATAGNAYLTAQNSGRDSSSNPNAILDQLDVANNLSQIINILHAVGPNAGLDTSNIADNSYGSYVNGAGKKQPIKVYPSGISNAPAIVFFNGGGWHVNDGTSYCVAIGSPQKNCQPGQNGGADTGARNIGAPAGGGALQRGYTAIEVTYRLGSSGVYYMLEDVMRGLRHVINNAGLYDIDPSKVAIWGDSAGGSLAMRVAATGKSGAKAAVGWSAPTNAYTALFKSFSSFLIGMDHSTCIPTDLAGAANTTNLLNGGSGDVAEYGQGLSSNDFSLLGIGGESDIGSNPIGTITQVLTAAQYAAETGKNIEAISKQLETAYNDGEPDMQSIMNSGLPSSVFNLSAKKLTECIDNFNTLSPALFASPESTPSFLAGFDTDNLIDPQQLYDMRDKLRSLGIRSDALVLPGDAEAGTPAIGASENHLGYDPRFVCESINFIDSVMQPDKGTVDCGTGLVNK